MMAFVTLLESNTALQDELIISKLVLGILLKYPNYKTPFSPNFTQILIALDQNKLFPFSHE